MRAPNPDPTEVARERGGRPAAMVRPTAGDDAGSRRNVSQVLKDIGLFFAAPVVTLVYVALFPLVGLAMLGRGLRHRKEPG